jgi:RNA polymerase sigma factor (sigma-70 family)
VKSTASKSTSEEWDSLWLQLRNGDRKGLEGLYNYFAVDLFKFGMTLAHEGDFVEDCVHEVFIDLWKYHKTLQKADNVKVYLFKSLSHKIYRESKKKGKWKTDEIREEYLDLFFVESVETNLIGVQREESLKRQLAVALEKLPIRQKEVIQYVFFERFSYEQISKIMGINLRSVYTLAWKAIAALKKLIVSAFLALAWWISL